MFEGISCTESMHAKQDQKQGIRFTLEQNKQFGTLFKILEDLKSPVSILPQASN